MSKSLDVLVLDFDRTLFDTDGYFARIADLLETDFGVDKATTIRDFHKYQFIKDGMQHYDFFAHVKAMGLNLDAVERVVITKLQGQFVYDDVPGVLSRISSNVETIVLTYGDMRHQQMKYRISGLDLKLYVSPGQKGPWLQERFGDKHGLMVDDRIIADLPSGFEYVQIDRTGQKPDIHTDLKFLGDYVSQ